MKTAKLIFFIFVALSSSIICTANESALDISNFYGLRTKQYSLGNVDQIIQFSPPRTGSTLLFNILKFLFENEQYLQSTSIGLVESLPQNVIKTHDLLGTYPNNAFFFVTIRHPIPSILSIFRVLNSPLNDKTIRTHLQNYIRRLNEIDRLIRKGKNVVVLRYEEFSVDMNYIFQAIEKGLSLEIHEQDKELMRTYLSKENVQNYIQQFQSFNEYDGTHFHGNHITDDMNYPSENEKYIRNQLIKLLRKHRKVLKKWGYDLEPKTNF